MNSRTLFLFYFLMVGLFFSCEEPQFNGGSDFQKIKLGDSIEWAGKNYDDRLWENEIPETGQEVFWVRMSTQFSKEEEGLKNQCILVGATGAYQAYWDGHYLEDNGKMASPKHSETPGTYIAYFLIPDSLLAEGQHVLALRTTQAHSPPGQHAFFAVGNYFELLRSPLQLSKYMFMFAGAFLITGIYFFFVFYNQPKEYDSLIFGFTCLIFCGLLLMEFVKLYYLYPYPFQRTRMEFVGVFHLLISILIPWFFVIQFSFPWKKILLGSLLLLTAFLQWQYHYRFDWIAEKHNMVMWLYALVIVLYACYEKKKGALTVLFGLVLCFIILFFTPYFEVPFVKSYDVSLFICFIVIVLAMLYVMTIKRKEERLAYEESLVVSERLKNELLKKNIKPHFIMNTLTSLMDWVEESPQEGVKFIQSLAAEFEVLNEIADYQQIPIRQEIKLCQSHLEVMGYRKEINYVWEEEGIDPNDIIPPAIIHTIIENGVTHSLPTTSGTITFRLLFEKGKNYKEYTLQTFAKNREPSKNKKPEAREGTGFKYIKARLQESYPDRWTLDSRANENGWQTSIKIFKL